MTNILNVQIVNVNILMMMNILKKDFGFTRLEVQYKTCVKCREKKNELQRAYGLRHRAEITERTREYNKQHQQDNKEQYKEWHKQFRERQLNKEVNIDQQCCTRCYKIKPVSEYGEYNDFLKEDGSYKLIPCKTCNGCRLRGTIRRGR
jgi:hypothetical protein